MDKTLENTKKRYETLKKEVVKLECILSEYNNNKKYDLDTHSLEVMRDLMLSIFAERNPTLPERKWFKNLKNANVNELLTKTKIERISKEIGVKRFKMNRLADILNIKPEKSDKNAYKKIMYLKKQKLSLDDTAKELFRLYDSVKEYEDYRFETNDEFFSLEDVNKVKREIFDTLDKLKLKYDKKFFEYFQLEHLEKYLEDYFLNVWLLKRPALKAKVDKVK